VLIAPVETVQFRESTTLIGTVIAPRSITVSNEIAGTVNEVSFESGGEVQEGQVLIRLDSRVEQAQRSAAKATLRLEETTLQRLRSIRGADAVSRIELDEALARRDEALALVAELTARIDRRSIVAPFRARAGLSDTQVGQYLSAGTAITSLQSLDGYQLVEFMLPQEVARKLTVGDPVTLRTEDDSLTARLIAFDALADRSTRNRKARARIDDPPASLQAGDSVKVEIHYGRELTAMAVPIQAVRRSPSGSLVYVAESNASGQTRARARSIEVGPADGKRVLVLAGLTSADKVVADGSFKLRDGALLADLAPARGPSSQSTGPQDSN
jgi:membrane fusion protein (multidrug efflux system)